MKIPNALNAFLTPPILSTRTANPVKIIVTNNIINKKGAEKATPNTVNIAIIPRITNTSDNNTFVVESVQQAKPGEGICSEQQTPLYYKGHLFCILPKDAGPLRNQFVCYHPDDISKLVWSSGTTHRFGLGPYFIADEKFFILSDEGILTVMQASTKEPFQLTQSKILDGHDAWGPMAIVNGRLLARDSRHLVCVDVRAFGF